MNNIRPLFLILIEEGVSIPTILGGATMLMVGIIGYFLKDAYGRVKEENKELITLVKELRTEVEINKDRLNSVDKRIDIEMRSMDGKLGDLRLNIIDKLELIKDKVNEVRK